MTAIFALVPDEPRFDRVWPAVTILVALWSWESLRPLWPGRKSRLRHGLRNLAMSAINAIVLFFTLGLLTAMLAAWTVENSVGILHRLDLPTVWRVALGFLVLDLWTYWWHRANHRVPFLWRFHRTHHSDAEMDCTTSARFHIGELTMAGLLRLPLIAAFGLDPLTIVVHETVLLAVSQFHHSNVALGRWDRFVRILIVTPALHQVHHSRRVRETNSNYASVLSVWDRIGRSFTHPDRVPPIELGLDQFDDPDWQTLGGMLRTPSASNAPPDVAKVPE